MHRNSESPGVAVSHKAVLVAASAAMVIGAGQWVHLEGANAVRLVDVIAEFTRCLLIAYVFARFIGRARVANWRGALVVTGWIWFAFQAAILAGSLIHEHMPASLYAVHAGYALVRDVAMVAILGAQRLGLGVREESKTTIDLAAGPNALPPAHLRIPYKAVLLAAAAALVVGAVWYSPALFGTAWAKLKTSASAGGTKVSPVEGLGELVRSGVVAYAIARFAALFRIADWKETAVLGAWVWLGFHATLLLYSVVHDHMPLMLFAIHAGHGFANDVVIAAIVGASRVKARARDGERAPTACTSSLRG